MGCLPAHNRSIMNNIKIPPSFVREGINVVCAVSVRDSSRVRTRLSLGSLSLLTPA